jgi:hypothetical protein
MNTDNADPAGPEGGPVDFACASCGHRAAASCRCGRARGDWLLAEDVIVIPAPRAPDRRERRIGQTPGQVRP